MPLTARDFEVVVGKLKMQSHGKKHRYVFLEHEGKKVIWTERSHGRGDIGAVEFAIRRQLKVNGTQMRHLVDCNMTRDAYIEHLKSIRVIETEQK